jgi:hypothetical protein
MTDGERMLVTKDVSENGTVIDKSVTIEGASAALRVNGEGTTIDVSGGDGLITNAEGIDLQNLYIDGGGSSNFGLKVGNGATHNALTMRNVELRNHGGHGITVDGADGGNQGHHWQNVITNGNSGDGLHIDVTSGGYFNQNEVHLRTWSNGGDGVYTASSGNEIAGNEWVWYAENNTGWGWYHDDGAFERNRIWGYGAEANGSGGLYLMDNGGREPNTLNVANLDSSTTRTQFWDEFRSRGNGGREIYGNRSGTLDYALYDDWGDGNATARDRHVEGNYVSDNGVIPARIRPDWDGGTVTGGAYRLSNGAYTDALSKHDTGSWEIDWQFVSDPTSGYLFIEFLLQDSSNRYEVLVGNGGTHQVKKHQGGSNIGIVSGSHPDDTNLHTTRVTRDSDGNWELFLDGSSQGTATDTFLPDVNFFRIESSLNADVDIHEIRCQ